MIFIIGNAVYPAVYDFAKVMVEYFDSKGSVVLISPHTAGKKPIFPHSISATCDMKVTGCGVKNSEVAPASKVLSVLRTKIASLRFFCTFYREIDLVVLHQLSDALIILLSRLLGKKTLVFVGGDPLANVRYNSFPMRILTLPINLDWFFTLVLAPKIMVPTDRTNLGLFNSKMVVTPFRLIAFEDYRTIRPLSKRENIVGYIGRFSYEKGVLELAEAIARIIKQTKSATNFVLVGDGPLKKSVVRIFHKHQIGKEVSIENWSPNVADYLSEMKLLLLPSRTEGLPSIMLEAMACGTPVLAAPVGAIPDIIKNGETGFLLESNNPEHIVERVLGLLNEQELMENVSKNASKWIRENLGKKSIINAWRKALAN